MNSELMLEIADQIEKEPRFYSQTTFGCEVYDNKNLCGTQSCVAGWALMLTGTPVYEARTLEEIVAENLDTSNVPNVARKLLDLDVEEADALFDSIWPRWWFPAAGVEHPKNDFSGVGRVVPTPKEAVQVMRWLAEVGRVFTYQRDWKESQA